MRTGLQGQRPVHLSTHEAAQGVQAAVKCPSLTPIVGVSNKARSVMYMDLRPERPGCLLSELLSPSP